MGFSVYTELTCKQCKPVRVFHKRNGLRFHSSTQHMMEGVQRSCPPTKSISEPSSRPTTVQSMSTNAFVKRQLKAPAKVVDIELIELGDEDVDEIEVVGERMFSIRTH